MTTNVPAASLTAQGFSAPLESEILAGVWADLQAAFGGELNEALSTPQGQLAQSLAAIIGDANDQLLELFNGVDPALAAGRFQDAIARIYFIERNPALPTTVVATCSGLTGTTIPLGAKAQDQSGNLYLCIEAGVIPVSGSIDLSFACATAGPIPCPSGFLSAIYQALPGWDSITNASDGVEGRDVESRADFELRRQQSVALNAQGSIASILAAVLNTTGVLDAYAAENPMGSAGGASFNASIAGTTMTVSSVASGTLGVGQMVAGASVAVGQEIVALGSGVGGTGTYILSYAQTVSSEAMTSAAGGVPMTAHSILVSAYGGTDQAVGEAIWSRKAPGCDYNGTTSVTVQDTANYQPPYPSYLVSFYRPTPTAVKFSVTMQSNAQVPSNAVDLVRAAMLAAFNGADGGPRARIGSAIFASRFYSAVAALGSWALIYSIQVGVGSADRNALRLPVTMIPTLVSADVLVSFT